MSAFEFRPPPFPLPALSPEKVQLWLVRLDQDEDKVRRIEPLLFPNERVRADRFHFPHLRTHYIAARGALRLLISALTGLPNDAIDFAYTQHEKPYLPESDLRFNVSHAHRVGLLAFTIGREIGVDVEYVRETIDAEQIAHRFFSAAEITDYLSVPQADRSQAFYNGWTRKEAYIKALGSGLTYPLDGFRVSLVPGEPARLIEVAADPAEAARWKMESVTPGEGYTGAVIAEGQDWELESWRFEFPEE